MSQTEDDVVEVYSAADLPQAYFLRDLLSDQGVEARVVGDALLTGTGILPLGEETAPKLWVLRHDEARARELLAEWERTQAEPRPAEAPSSMWKCPTCGELVEEQFDLCWNCQTPRKPY